MPSQATPRLFMRAAAFSCWRASWEATLRVIANRHQCSRSEDYLFSNQRILHHHGGNNPTFCAFLTTSKLVPRWAKDGHGPVLIVNRIGFRHAGNSCSFPFPKLFAGCLAIVGNPSLR